MASENSGCLILMTLPTGRRSSYKGQGPESTSLPHAPSLWPANRMHAENFKCGPSSARGKESMAPRGEGCAVLCFNGGGGSTSPGERGVVFGYCSLSRRGNIYQHFILMFQEKKTLQTLPFSYFLLKIQQFLQPAFPRGLTRNCWQRVGIPSCGFTIKKLSRCTFHPWVSDAWWMGGHTPLSFFNPN